MGEECWGEILRLDWREYNERLVARGEAYISLDFIEMWDRDLEKLKRGRVGASYV